MKVLALIIFSLSWVFVWSLYGAEELRVFVEHSETNATSEYIPFKMCFTNAGDKAISILKPVIGRDFVVRVYSKTGDELARSAIQSEYMPNHWKNVNKEWISLKPNAIWDSEEYDLFAVVYPVFRITPNQTVRAEVSYSLNGVMYVTDVLIGIPSHDMVIKPEYISKEKAVELAVAELRRRGFFANALLKGIVPDTQCINGVYRVSYSRSVPQGVLGDSLIVSVKVDAKTGKVLQILGQGD